MTSTQLAAKADLDAVLGWLEREHEKNDEGFWCNRRIIKSCFDEDDLWVIRRDGRAVAFRASGDIFCVKEDYQRRGIGKQMVGDWIAHSFRNGMNLLYGECMPQSSLPFWESCGFERYDDVVRRGVCVRRVLHRPLAGGAHMLPLALAVLRAHREPFSHQQDQVGDGREKGQRAHHLK